MHAQQLQSLEAVHHEAEAHQDEPRTSRHCSLAPHFSMHGSYHARAPPTYAGEMTLEHCTWLHQVSAWPETKHQYEVVWTSQSVVVLNRSINPEERHADMLCPV